MSCHAALGVVKAGVAALKGESYAVHPIRLVLTKPFAGSGVRINCISAGQIDVGVNLGEVHIAFPNTDLTLTGIV